MLWHATAVWRRVRELPSEHGIPLTLLKRREGQGRLGYGGATGRLYGQTTHLIEVVLVVVAGPLRRLQRSRDRQDGRAQSHQISLASKVTVAADDNMNWKAGGHASEGGEELGGALVLAFVRLVLAVVKGWADVLLLDDKEGWERRSEKVGIWWDSTGRLYGESTHLFKHEEEEDGGALGGGGSMGCGW